MTERDDRTLVEAVARAICSFDYSEPDRIIDYGAAQRPRWSEYTDVAQAVLAAIDASGTHLVARRCQPVWGSCALPSGHNGQHNAHALAERQGEGR